MFRQTNIVDPMDFQDENPCPEKKRTTTQRTGLTTLLHLAFG
jgi:hypothetical protein